MLDNLSKGMICFQDKSINDFYHPMEEKREKMPSHKIGVNTTSFAEYPTR